MKMKNLVITSFISLFSAALLAVSAHAQLATYNDMDALMGFRVLSGPGAALEGVIDLGPVGNFNHTQTLTLGSNFAGAANSYMVTNFGADWYTRHDTTNTSLTAVQWGVVATDNLTGFTNDMWATRNPAIRSTPWTATNNQGGPSTEINTAGTTFANSTVAAGTTDGVVQGASESNSRRSVQPGGNGGLRTISFDFFNPSIEGNTNTTLAFDSVPQSGTSSTLGFFSWNSDGTLTFTVVPEPATYQMFALGAMALCGVMILRRRRAAKAA